MNFKQKSGLEDAVRFLEEIERAGFSVSREIMTGVQPLLNDAEAATDRHLMLGNDLTDPQREQIKSIFRAGFCAAYMSASHVFFRLITDKGAAAGLAGDASKAIKELRYAAALMVVVANEAGMTEFGARERGEGVH